MSAGISPNPAEQAKFIPVAATATDPTARLAELERALIDAQRLATRGAMSAMFAHEMNNVMTPILARLEAATDSKDIEYLRSTLKKTLANAQRAIALTMRMLGGGEPACTTTEFNAAAAIQAALDDCPRPFEKDGIEFSVSVAPALCLRGDAALFAQLILDLLLIARETLVTARGKLSITADGTADGCAQLDVTETATATTQRALDSEFNEILADDSTPSPADLTRPRLALLACRLIVRQSGATIQALPATPRGRIFRITWPLAGV